MYNITMNKVCTVCNINKPFDAFHKHKGGQFNLSGRCKECKNSHYREQYKENNEKEIERSRQYRKNNVYALKERSKIRREKEKSERLAATIKRRLSKLHRTPKWLTKDQLKEITEFYKMAKELEKVFPWKQCVDHIVPLQGKTVSGLHVPWNLQILSAKDNMEKGNKFHG
jgi:hypothetical protein